MQNKYLHTKYMTLRSLENMVQLLKKIQEQLPQKDFSETELLDTRLAPDMFSFVRQIQIMSDNAKGLNARLSGVDAPSMEDKEQSLEELITRLENTRSFVKSIPDEAYEAADSRQIILPYFSGKYQTAEDYLKDFAIPNFYFHFVTAYAILRMKGFEIGKADFSGVLNLRDL